MTAIKRVCHLCEAMCGLSIQKKDAPHAHSPSLHIRANPDDVFSKGAFCPKSQGLSDLHLDPDRLRQPLKRVGSDFVPISWDQAFADISQRLNQLQKDHGRSSVASYVGNPNVHNFGSLMALPFFFKALRSPNQYSATSVDQLPHMLVAYHMFGHQFLLPISDVDHADYVLILGANPSVSNGSLLSAAGLSSRLKRLTEKGGKVVVLDPRYTETASIASDHHFIRPGTDAFFLSALVKLLLPHAKIGRLRAMVKGFEELVPLFEAIDLARVAAVTGIGESEIHEIAREFRERERAFCYGRMGVSTQAFGTVCQWLINLVNILSGNFDEKGGVLFTKPALDSVEMMAKFGTRGSFGRRRSRVRNLPEFSGEFPSATLADEILTEGKGQVRGLVTVAGNPVLSLPNGRKLERALASLDFYVAIDIYQNETTRFAHYILPPCSPLEHDHFDLVFNALAARNVVRYSPALFEAPADSREDWEILLELWARLDISVKPWQRPLRLSMTKALRKIGTTRLLDMGLRMGPYKGLTLKKLRENPDGIDLGPLEPSLPDRLYTKDKKINLTPAPLLEAFALFRKDQLWQGETRRPGEWLLIGRRNLKSNNSWMHNLPSLQSKKDPCFLIMHESDGRDAGIRDGSIVRVSTEVGSIEVPVSLTTRIMPGVVSLPHGWGHHRSDTKLNLARSNPGVSMNDIVDDRGVDLFSGNAVLNGQTVRIQNLNVPEDKNL